MDAVFPSAVLLLFVCSVHGLCRHEWTPFRGSCYHLFEDKQPWPQAMVLCRSHIAHLVIIETSEENKFLEDFVKNRQVHREYVWIGANDMMKEGVWRWTGTDENVTFTDWATYQPDNWADDQNCVAIRPDVGYKWDDDKCSMRYHYMCETSPVDSIVG